MHIIKLHLSMICRERDNIPDFNGTVYIADPNFGAVLRFFANKFWLPFSRSGDVRIYSKKELEMFFYSSGFRTVRVYKKEKGVFLMAKK